MFVFVVLFTLQSIGLAVVVLETGLLAGRSRSDVNGDVVTSDAESSSVLANGGFESARNRGKDGAVAWRLFRFSAVLVLVEYLATVLLIAGLGTFTQRWLRKAEFERVFLGRLMAPGLRWCLKPLMTYLCTKYPRGACGDRRKKVSG